MTKFLLDTNSFIDAKNFFYAFDICPGFWQSLRRHHKSEQVYSIDQVKKEITDGSDMLVRWAKWMPKGFFQISHGPDVAVEYSKIITWVDANFTRREAVDAFADKADGWLIAYAKVYGYTLVCQEKFDPNVKRRVPNPNVCHHFGVPFCNMFEMLRAINAKFGLKKRLI